jgi:hypothetical protein
VDGPSEDACRKEGKICTEMDNSSSQKDTGYEEEEEEIMILRMTAV